jgi:hypothetical protein
LRLEPLVVEPAVKPLAPGAPLTAVNVEDVDGAIAVVDGELTEEPTVG